MSDPLVAIVGRPNVGKSTLFNRIIGRRSAIVEERPGVTRDRKEEMADWTGRDFRILDTGGWMPGGEALDKKVTAQAEQAMEEADVILLVVDGTIGITEEDSLVARKMHLLGTPTLLVVNKIDGQTREHLQWEFARLGLGSPYPISALHGRLVGDLLDDVVAFFPGLEPEDEDGLLEIEEGIPAVAIVGRPNVGKSTLFNRMIGEERSVVHDMPGTTRDVVDTIIATDHGDIKFVDTAGMRRRARIDEATEYYSVVRALQAVDLSDVALLVIDATEGITHQDQRLAERVDGAGCPIVVALNKWETLDAEERKAVLWQLGDRLHFLGEAPVLKISALTGKGVHRLLPAIGLAIEAYERRVPTRKVNEVIQSAQQNQPAPGGAKVLYATQGATNPPTFTLFINKDLPKTYMRYLERRLREAFDLGATPIKLRVRRRG